MAAVLVEDMKCDYNMDLVASGIMANEQSTAFFRDSRDVFIHGLLMDKRGGTCSSMPVLLTAMSQRLGYPVKLATAKGHVIAIWDDGKERFTIGYAGKGITLDTDDFYSAWDGQFPYIQQQKFIQNKFVGMRQTYLFGRS